MRISTCAATTRASRTRTRRGCTASGDEFGFDIVHQVGLRSGERAEWHFARAHNAWSSDRAELAADGPRAIGARPVYVSIDIDVLDPAHAPGTGCPEPAA